jgi:hypothetical protein
MKLSAAIRNSMISQYETYLGTSPTIELRTGLVPASTTDVDTGTLLAVITLPLDWLSAPVNGTVSLQGSWVGTTISSGTATHYRLKNSSGITHEQGSVSITGGGGDLELDNTNLALNQIVQVTTWTRTQGGQ